MSTPTSDKGSVSLPSPKAFASAYYTGYAYNALVNHYCFTGLLRQLLWDRRPTPPAWLEHGKVWAQALESVTRKTRRWMDELRAMLEEFRRAYFGL
ncbi:MAG: hypothetical protein Q9208_000425 [Pyrenodesmia sp. 3 TL-2023]